MILDENKNDYGNFSAFYRPLELSVRKNLMKLDLLTLENINELICQLMQPVYFMGFRCLLQELHEYRQEGKLHGDDPRGEFEYFTQIYLSNDTFRRQIWIKYPLLELFVTDKLKNTVNYIKELLCHLKKDKDLIIQHLCHGQIFSQVKSMSIGLSDEHFPGKTVVRLILDNGYTLFYKPHGLAHEVLYKTISDWADSICGQSTYTGHHILDRGDYGWENGVEFKTCESEKEIKRFYERMGRHVCLAYLLSISDIHFENVIAHGEYPVLIDAEVFPDRRLDIAIGEKKSMHDTLKDTVMNTGMLRQRWLGKNMSVGAFGSCEPQQSPVRVPVVKNKGTSEMAIEYTYPTIDSSAPIPALHGKKQECEQYLEDIIQGFRNTYQAVLENREQFIAMIKPVFSYGSRFVLRNTQEYAMYLNALNFPELLGSDSLRRKVLEELNPGLACRECFKTDILQYEKECLYWNRIPIFYAEGKALYTGEGKKLDGFFSSEVQSGIMDRLEHLSPNEERIQERIIVTSFMSALKKKNISVSAELIETGQLNEPLTDVKIFEWIKRDLISDDDDFGWLGLYYNKQDISTRFIDMNLYGGISGIAIFAMAMYVKYKTIDYKAFACKLAEKIFDYTDSILKGDRKASEHSGIFEGEGSIVYTYLILFEMSGQAKYLDYAVKHSDILVKYADKDEGVDLLSGKAGGLIAMLRLFMITGDESLVFHARETAAALLDQAYDMDGDLFWKGPGQNYPLAGMAHGNSGIALAFAELYNATGIEEYKISCLRVIKSEDRLFREDWGNWCDLRNYDGTPGTEKDTVAWCHGAAGILLARIRIYEILKLPIENDEKIMLAYAKICQTVKEDTCLCHGNAGLLFVLSCLDSKYGIKNCNMVDLGFRWPPYALDLTVEDCYNPGFMNGLAGIGYALMVMEASDEKAPHVKAKIINILCASIKNNPRIIENKVKHACQGNKKL